MDFKGGEIFECGIVQQLQDRQQLIVLFCKLPCVLEVPIQVGNVEVPVRPCKAQADVFRGLVNTALFELLAGLTGARGIASGLAHINAFAGTDNGNVFVGVEWCFIWVHNL